MPHAKHAKQVRRTIFRAEAIHHYIQGRAETVLPQVVSPRAFRHLWLLLALLVAVGAFGALLSWVPTYATGVAIAIAPSDYNESADNDVVLAILMPPEDAPRLRVGQALLLRDATGARFGTSITDVEPEVVSPAAARSRFGLGPGTALAVTQPSAVAIARLHPPRADLSAFSYTDSIYRADVTIGTRRVASFLPLADRLYRK